MNALRGPRRRRRIGSRLGMRSGWRSSLVGSRACGGGRGRGSAARPLRRLARRRLGEQRHGAPRAQRQAGRVLQPGEHRLDQLRQLGHRLQRQVRVRGQLPRVQHLRPHEPGRADAEDVRRLPGRPGRHVRRGATCSSCRSRRPAARSTAALTPAGDRGDAVPRRPHLRRQQHRGAGADRGGADVPRLAHAHARHEPERHGQHLRLRLRHRRASARPPSWPAAAATARSPIRPPRTSAST